MSGGMSRAGSSEEKKSDDGSGKASKKASKKDDSSSDSGPSRTVTESSDNRSRSSDNNDSGNRTRRSRSRTVTESRRSFRGVSRSRSSVSAPKIKTVTFTGLENTSQLGMTLVKSGTLDSGLVDTLEIQSVRNPALIDAGVTKGWFVTGIKGQKVTKYSQLTTMLNKCKKERKPKAKKEGKELVFKVKELKITFEDRRPNRRRLASKPTSPLQSLLSEIDGQQRA